MATTDGRKQLHVAINIQRLPAATHLSPLINLVELTLPRVQGLPQNAESTMDVHTDDVRYLKKAFDGLQPEVARFLEEQSPDWIIYDFAHYWLPPIAAGLGISRAFFSIFSPWTIAFLGSSSENMINSSDGRTTAEDFMTPPKWFPFQSKKICTTYRWFPWDYCHPEHTETRKMMHGRQSIKEWLDGQQKGHVVYVALGSEAVVNKSGLAELALGLELSGLPFFWALRKPAGLDSVELPDGFLERTHNRGVVWTRWAPQVRILSHESVCGFLTHGGLSSVVEGLMLGHPLVMLPIFGDQFVNVRVLADKQVGIEIPRNEENGYFTKESVARSLRSVVVDEEGKIYKANARELGKVFSDTKLEKKDYVSCFVDYLEKNVGVVGSHA
ncbi:hypothetical protein E3N88_01659 [Mikania micrantha]|uniref:Uncharacterized protein n=1 Tax=Mikania micrantha TaxID=192012 RepID=A0A5N6Q267_9ASTR|nr:hypothetical protein E3N88_01659 [Mikania micrantha]